MYLNNSAISVRGAMCPWVRRGFAFVGLALALTGASGVRAGSLELELTQLDVAEKHSFVFCPGEKCASAIELRVGESRQSFVLRAVVRPGGVLVAIFDGIQPLDFGGQPFTYIPTGHDGFGERIAMIHPPVEARSPPIPMFHYPVIVVPTTVLARARIRVQGQKFGDRVE